MKHVFHLLKSARELWGYYAAISFFTIVLSLLTLLQPLLSGWAIDAIRLGREADMHYVMWLAVGIFVLDLAQTIFSNVSGFFGDQMAVKLNRILSVRYYEHVLSLPQTYFDTELTGKIVNRLNRSIQQLTRFMQTVSNNFLQFIFTTVFSLIAVAYYSWEVALMLLALYPIYIWLTFKSSNTWQNYQKTKNEHIDIASGRFAEAIGQVKVVKSFIQEKREIRFFSRHLKTVIDTDRPQSRFWHKEDIKRRLILNVIFLGVYAFIFTQGARGAFTPGQAVALILYAMQIRLPIFTISFLVENTQRAIADSREYFEVMNVEPETADSENAKPLRIQQAAIRFEDVVFGYNETTVLKNITLDITPDTKVALVGESGEGKTTLTNLLLRLYEPNSGRILIDDQNISNITQHSLREHIGVVFQEPMLFSGTIQENIGYARSSAKDSEIVAAAKAANAHEFISKLENGYQTQIGERGLKLSGGQKQRIAISRALLKDAPILILDEATSSLDSRSEHMVQEALERLMRGRTTLIIAHRLSTIEHVDQIVTLKNGQVDEVGSPQELARSGGIYGQLLELQRGGSSESTKKKLRKFDISG